MLLETAIVVVAAAALLKPVVKPQPQPQFQPAMATSVALDRRNCDYIGDGYFDLPLQRVSYGTKPGARVLGWPAKGGVYHLDAATVDLDFLGYGRFETIPRPDPKDPNTAADEEAHCNKMRQLGAQWWESEHAWARSFRVVHAKPQKEEFIATGWPAGGGVWVLSEDIEAAGGKHAGMLFNVYTMEERCNIIEKLGGTFYANPKDCPDLDLA